MTNLTNGDIAPIQGSLGATILRITLGVIILVTWFDNLDKGLYSADGLTGFLDWLFDENGNASTLTAYESFLDVAVKPVAGAYGVFQLVVELAMGVGLIVGAFTRLFSLAAAFFFFNLILSYFGGHEWIWTYVLLMAAAVAVFLDNGGRRFGVDVWLTRTRGRSPFGLVW